MRTNKLLSKIVEQRGIKQIYISEKTGLSADVISKILRSERKMTAEEFLAICDALGINPNEFRATA